MNIALIGYGAMNKQIKLIAEERGHTVSVIVSPNDEIATDEVLSEEALKDIDVAIDFSLPAVAIENMKTVLATDTNIVVGTTGWYDQLDEVKKMTEASDAGLLWSSNFSIGVNMYFKIVEEAAKLVDQYDEYDVWGHEIHHHNKADSPSGTAKSLEKILLEHISRKTEVAEEKLDRKIEPHELHFSSTRAGAVNFSHTIGLDSSADTITMTHTARNRGGYALGAVKAAEWLEGKKGFFSMDDFLRID